MNTYEEGTRPVRLWAHWFQTTILDGNPFCWEGVGTLYVKCEDEYVGVLDETPYLFPPRIALLFEPSAELISLLQKRDFSTSKSFSQDSSARLLSEISSSFSYEEFASDLEQLTRSFILQLLEGKSAYQEGFGTLSLHQNVEGSVLEYTPDSSFVVRLQKPFEAFEPTLLKSLSLFPDLYIKKISSTEIEVLPQIFSIPKPELENSKEEDNITTHSPSSQGDELQDQHEEVTTPPLVKSKKNPFILISIILLLFFIVGGGVLGYLTLRKGSEPESTVPITTHQEIENSESLPPQPIVQESSQSSPIAIEMIERGITLSGLAHKYYGNVIFWVCIYMENYSVISDYNNIPLGQEIKIPPLDKYKMKGDSAEDISKCRKIEYLIYSSQYKPGDENNL
ncbi:MAG: hypothetical protein Q3998_05580 [Porphyromonas sp.]|nr:hypothetical protein [Porphyromonas sp.]